MAAYLNRTISMVTGNGGNAGSSKYDANALTDNRSMQNAAAALDKSPLQVFVRAKKKINDIYGEVEEYVIETTQFINGKLQFYPSLSSTLENFCRNVKGKEGYESRNKTKISGYKK